MKFAALEQRTDRRSFLRASAAAAFAAAVAVSPISQQVSQAAPSQQGGSDLDILNYALTLEHLEAEAYRIAINSGLMSGAALTYFRQFGEHEADHVVTLTQTIRDLGGQPVQAQSSYNFPSFGSQSDIVTYFQMVEELGAAAYLGQAPRLQNSDLLTAAVSIHNVEAQHAAILSDLIGVAPAPAFGEPQTMDEVLTVVTPILMPADEMPDEMPNTGFGGGRYIKRQPAIGEYLPQ